MDSFTEVFEAYKNMRDHSEINAEIAEIKNFNNLDIPGETDYFRGYVDALEWIIGADSYREPHYEEEL